MSRHHLLAVLITIVSLSILFKSSHAFTNNVVPTAAQRPAAITTLILEPPVSFVSTTPCFDTASITPSTTLLRAVPPPEVWTSVLPPFMGLVKYEWGVSYGYGFAVALSALSVLRRTAVAQLPLNPVVAWQAAALIFFGLRLNLFLFLRTRLSSRIQDFQTKIEERAQSNGGRLSRLPFILGCGFLYYGLVCPLLLTSQLPAGSVPPMAMTVMKILVGIQWAGYLTAALGDMTKTIVKQTKGDEKFLVTSGPFAMIRHPNYTGEIVAWTSNALCGSLAGTCLLRRVSPFSVPVISTMTVATLGWVGIVVVLLRATANLEKKQKNEYGDSPKYQKWIQNTWSGWVLPEDNSSAGTEPHEVSMDAETKEASGSGI